MCGAWFGFFCGTLNFFFFFFLMIRRPPRSTHCISSAASDVYKRQAFTTSSRESHTATISASGFNAIAGICVLDAIPPVPIIPILTLSPIWEILLFIQVINPS
eukprot:TRINITY_DN16778_c0_g1_i1.p4 TRINITY_DN16778_c0_g1~~TRINITY_DN16778_c0_g1_i1.p4  ORF type:complete len:103 (-),score=20.08 TRINITY_DN16778_c0_g1_i1:676-984(-)